MTGVLNAEYGGTSCGNPQGAGWMDRCRFGASYQKGPKLRCHGRDSGYQFGVLMFGCHRVGYMEWNILAAIAVAEGNRTRITTPATFDRNFHCDPAVLFHAEYESRCQGQPHCRELGTETKEEG